MKKNKSNTQTPQRLTLGSSVALCFLAAMFTLFPLAINITLTSDFPFISFRDGFIAIRHIKYYFFVVAAAFAVIAEVLLLLTQTVNSGGRKSTEISKPRFPGKMSFTDWAALALLLSCAVSTVFSPYLELAFFGEIRIGSFGIGRNNGLLIILLYVLVYFVLTRFYVFREWIFTALSVTTALVSLLTVLNGFYLDPLDMLSQFKLSSQSVYMEFFSTIGNKNMLSSFLCVTVPVSFCMAVHTEKTSRRIIYLISLGLGATAVIIGDSDSAILGMGAFLLIYLTLYSRNPAKLKRYFLSLTVMLASVKLLRLFSLMMHDNYKELGTLTSSLMLGAGLYPAIALCAAITVLLYVLHAKKPDFRFRRALPIAVLIFGGVLVLGGIAAIVWFTAFDTETDLGGMERLLRFNGFWGTHRGIMWQRSVDIFLDASPLQKIFGTGPDTFYFAYQPYFSELEEYGNTSTDAAHNEYLNYLVTIGISGLLSYLAFVGGSLRNAFKNSRSAHYLIYAAPVTAYLAQAVVNIAVPISAPLFFIFVSLCAVPNRAEES